MTPPFNSGLGMSSSARSGFRWRANFARVTAQPPVQYPESSQATTALVLSILGLVLCWVLPPVAWVIANGELRGIAEGRRDPNGRGMATAARIMGIIGTVLLIIGIGIFLLVFISSGDVIIDTFDELST